MSRSTKRLISLCLFCVFMLSIIVVFVNNQDRIVTAIDNALTGKNTTDLEYQIQELEIELQNRHLRIQELEEELRIVRSELHNANELNLQYQAIHEQDELEILRLQGVNSELNDSITTLQNNYSTLNGQYQGLLSDYADLQDDLSDLQIDYNSLNSNYESLQSNYNSLNSQYQSLLSEYSDLQDELADLENELSDLQDELDDLQSDYDLLDTNYQTLQSSYNLLSTQYQNLLSEYTDLENELDDLQNDYDLLESNYQTLQGNYNSLNSDYQSLLSDYGTLYNQYQSLLNASVQQPALFSPTISISNDILTITPNSGNGNFVTGYKLIINNEVVDTLRSLTIDLNYYLYFSNTYDIKVSAVGLYFEDSIPSNIISYTYEASTSASLFTIENGVITGYVGNESDIKIPSTYSLSNPQYSMSTGVLFSGEDFRDSMDFEIFDDIYSYNQISFSDSINGSIYTAYNNTILSSFLYNNFSDDFYLISASFSNTYAARNLLNLLYDYPISCNGQTFTNRTSFENYITNNNITNLNFVCTITSYSVIDGNDYTITAIGERAFESKNILTRVIIPSSITSIGTNAFSQCRNLSSIYLPNTITSIGVSAFSYCTSLTSIDLPSSLTSISASSFFQSGLSSITIPNTITSIGYQAFAYCYFTSITFESGTTITSIPERCFYHCANLTSIVIPSSITSIGNNAFVDSGITSVVVDSNNTYYTSRNSSNVEINCIMDINLTTLIYAPDNFDFNLLPSSVVNLGRYSNHA